MRGKSAGPGDANPQAVLHYLLAEWARWRRYGHGAVAGFSNQDAVRRLRGGGLPAASIPDPVACLVDQCVSQAVQENREAGEAFLWYWFSGKAHHQVAERMGVSRQRVTAWVKAVEVRVEELLDEE